VVQLPVRRKTTLACRNGACFHAHLTVVVTAEATLTPGQDDERARRSTVLRFDEPRTRPCAAPRPRGCRLPTRWWRKADARHEFKGHVWIDALTCVEFISSRVGKAYVGVGSAPRGDTAPREKSWERAERAAGGR
jgi:hypothetical protein